MSERFEAVVKDLKWLVSLGQGARTSDVAELHQAMRILEDWPRWEPLVRAGQGVDREALLKILGKAEFPDGDLVYDKTGRARFASDIRALLDALPDGE